LDKNRKKHDTEELHREKGKIEMKKRASARRHTLSLRVSDRTKGQSRKGCWGGGFQILLNLDDKGEGKTIYPNSKKESKTAKNRTTLRNQFPEKTRKSRGRGKEENRMEKT